MLGSVLGPDMWPKPAQKAPKMTSQRPKECQDELQVAVTWQLLRSTETSQKPRILRCFRASGLPKSDSRNAQEASCCHFEPPRSDKEEGMRRLRQRAPKRDRKRAKNEPRKGPRNEFEMIQKRGPKRSPKMACESLLSPTEPGPGSERVRALILCNV